MTLVIDCILKISSEVEFGLSRERSADLESEQITALSRRSDLMNNNACKISNNSADKMDTREGSLNVFLSGPQKAAATFSSDFDPSV